VKITRQQQHQYNYFLNAIFLNHSLIRSHLLSRIECKPAIRRCANIAHSPSIRYEHQ